MSMFPGLANMRNPTIIRANAAKSQATWEQYLAAQNQDTIKDMIAKGILNPDGTYNWKNDANAQEANQRQPVVDQSPAPAQNQEAVNELVAKGVLNPDGTYNWKNDANAQEANQRLAIVNQSPAQAAWEQQPIVNQSPAPAAQQPVDPDGVGRNHPSLQDGFVNELPIALKPKIERDKDGNEIVTIQGSLLNKIMRDMYSAGQELGPDPELSDPLNAQPQNQAPNPYGPHVQADQNSVYGRTLLDDLQKSYPGRSTQDLARILRGG